MTSRTFAVPLPLYLYFFLLLSFEASLVLAHFLWGGNRFFDLDKEFNLPTWFASVQFFALGLAALVILHLEGREREALEKLSPSCWGWGALALLFFYLSCDEALVLHEKFFREELRHLIPPDSLLQSLPPWQILFAPAIALVLAFFVVFFFQRFGGHKEILLPAAGGVSLWVLALGLEGMATPVFISRRLYRFEVALEEGAEMVGTTFLLFSLARYALGIYSKEICLPLQPLFSFQRRRGWYLIGGVAALLILTSPALIWWTTNRNAAWLYRHTAARLLKERAYTRALVVYQKALEQNPQDVEALKGLGFTYYRLQRYPEATEAYRQALTAKPQDAQLMTDLALVLHHAGKWEEALFWYQKALEVDPRSSKTLSNLRRLKDSLKHQER